ncbi:ATPase-AAA-core domain-containing protein [Mycena kentingensis (nom. inval.)]|nr:ATPase-AAA-core domain-containing protein [Mycena kentingensis (nom. inval.)]
MVLITPLARSSPFPPSLMISRPPTSQMHAPHSQPTASGVPTQLTKLAGCLAAALDTLHVLADNLNTPFLHPISSTVRSLLKTIENVKHRVPECVQLMNKTLDMLYLVIALHFKTDIPGELPPDIFEPLGAFTVILHKIFTFVDAQQARSRTPSFLRHFESALLLKDCRSGIRTVIQQFQLPPAQLANEIERLRADADITHRRVMELVQSANDCSASEMSSTKSNLLSFNSSHNSSSAISISILPPTPKIFHGRETELSAIIDLFRLGSNSPKIPILGPGGIGKTSLARCVLHHLAITSSFGDHRYFVGCEGASTFEDLLTLLAGHLEIKSTRRAMQQILSRLEVCGRTGSLLILDNLETVWELDAFRKQVDDFLARLAAIDGLALLVTMRGSERPSTVCWTRPFIAPLQPLSEEAARRTFADIAETEHEQRDVDRLLQLTGNMPLAIDLLANMVDCEGFEQVLAQWEREKTAMLSDGHTTRSNLDMSISLSLASPRLTSTPDAMKLLSLLSVLPDGLSELEFAHAKLFIADPLACRSALLRTSLAYLSAQRRLKLLVPIQEYVQRYHAPEMALVTPIFTHYHDLLALFRKHLGTIENTKFASRIAANVANIQSILAFRISRPAACDPDRSATIYCGVDLNMFARYRGQREIPFMALVPAARPVDHKLEVHFLAEVFRSYASRVQGATDPETLVSAALDHLTHLEDADAKCGLYNCLGRYYIIRDTPKSKELYQQALDLASAADLPGRECMALNGLANIAWNAGTLYEGHVLASRAQRAGRRASNLIREAAALRMDGLCLQALGHYAAAIARYERALSLFAPCGMEGCDLEVGVLSSWAEAHKLKSEFAEARAIHARLLQRAPLEDNPAMHGFILNNIAEVDVPLGAPADEVQRTIDASRRAFHTNGPAFPMELATCDVMEADLFLREGDFVAAKTGFERNLRLTWGRYNELTSLTLEKLGDVRRWASEYWTYRWPTLLLVHSLKNEETRTVWRALQFLGDLLHRDGDTETAVTLWTLSLEGFTALDVHFSRGECLARLGDVFRLSGDICRGDECHRQALPLFQCSAQPKYAQEAHNRAIIE